MGKLAQAFADLEEKKIYKLLDELLADNVNVLEIIDECNQGMAKVGELFSENVYFISQLIYSAELLKRVMAKLEPLLDNIAEDTNSKGSKVVIGTVKGDIHDIWTFIRLLAFWLSS